MAITIYGIRNCDTMRKAMKWLDSRDIAYHFHDYRKEGVPEVALRRWLRELGQETVINRRSTTWRKLDAEIRAQMNTETAVQQACANPSLIRRPILEAGTRLRAGFHEADWNDLLK